VSTDLSEGLGLVVEDGREEQSWEQEVREHKRAWRQPGKLHWESEDSEEESNKTFTGTVTRLDTALLQQRETGSWDAAGAAGTRRSTAWTRRGAAGTRRGERT
jgi:hypothetical protein